MEMAIKIGSLVDENAAASQEQHRVIERISKAGAEMDKVTQQTTTNAQESASASEEMNARAEQLKRLVWDLTTVIGGNGLVAESRSESSSARMNGIVCRDNSLQEIA